MENINILKELWPLLIYICFFITLFVWGKVSGKT
jgi:hypothetical protein